MQKLFFFRFTENDRIIRIREMRNGKSSSISSFDIATQNEATSHSSSKEDAQNLHSQNEKGKGRADLLALSLLSWERNLSGPN